MAAIGTHRYNLKGSVPEWPVVTARRRSRKTAGSNGWGNLAEILLLLLRWNIHD
jgi:hypothetical protein